MASSAIKEISSVINMYIRSAGGNKQPYRCESINMARHLAREINGIGNVWKADISRREKKERNRRNMKINGMKKIIREA